MGMGSLDLQLFIRLKKQGFLTNGSSVLEIGAQQLSNDFLTAQHDLQTVAEQFGVKFPAPFLSFNARGPTFIHGGLEHLSESAPSARLFWQWLGLKYSAIDIDESPGSIPLDLNYDTIPRRERGKYQLVTNLGTTEHVANQLNAFKVIHELTALNGIMFHGLPSQGMQNHGLVNYNPKFFWMLARSNAYKWIYINYRGPASYYTLPQNIVDHVKEYNPDIIEQSEKYQVADTSLWVILQKVLNTPYVSPLDVPTGTNTSNKTLQKRYWSIFTNPF